MKFIVNSEELSKNVQGLAKTVNGRSSLAILDHFLFEVMDDKLDVTASDGENMMRVTVNLIECSMVNDDREKRFCIHNSMIGDFLKNIPSQPITFDVDMDGFVVKVSYMNGHIQFPCTAGSEYPVIHLMKDEYQTVSLPSDMMLNDICRTVPFIGQDTLRPVINSICFNFSSEGLDVVSTSGSVLMKISHPELDAKNTGTFLLPTKPAALLKYFLEKNMEVKVKFTENGAVFECDNWKLTCRLIEGRYPNYNSVIPMDNSLEIRVDKKCLQEAIKRMLPMGNQEMKTLKLEIAPDMMTVSCQDLNYNTSATESIPCETIGNTITIGLNGEILCSVLSHINTDAVRMKMVESSRPVIILPDENIEGEYLTSLVMPMMITE